MLLTSTKGGKKCTAKKRLWQLWMNGDSRPLTLLITGAEANKEFAKKQALELQSKSGWHKRL